MAYPYFKPLTPVVKRAFEIAKLKARVAELENKLRLIGDFAHDRSHGPVIYDDLWWVREQAYDSL